MIFMKKILFSMILLLILASGVVLFYPSSLTKTIGIADLRAEDVDHILLTVYPTSGREFVSHEFTNQNDLEKVISVLSSYTNNKKVRRSFFRFAPTSELQYGYYIFLKFKDDAGKADIAFYVFTGNQIIVNGKQHVIYGEGLSPNMLTDLIALIK